MFGRDRKQAVFGEGFGLQGHALVLGVVLVLLHVNVLEQHWVVDVDCGHVKQTNSSHGWYSFLFFSESIIIKELHVMVFTFALLDVFQNLEGVEDWVLGKKMDALFLQPPNLQLDGYYLVYKVCH